MFKPHSDLNFKFVRSDALFWGWIIGFWVYPVRLTALGVNATASRECKVGIMKGSHWHNSSVAIWLVTPASSLQQFTISLWLSESRASSYWNMIVRGNGEANASPSARRQLTVIIIWIVPWAVSACQTLNLMVWQNFLIFVNFFYNSLFFLIFMDCLLYSRALAWPIYLWAPISMDHATIIWIFCPKKTIIWFL